MQQVMMRIRPWARHYRWPLALSALVLIYFVAITDRRYASEARLVVQSASGAPDSFSVAMSLFGGGGGRHDALLLRERLLSPDTARELDAKHGLRQAYARNILDRYWHVAEDGAPEAFYEVYQQALEVSFSEEAQVLRIVYQDTEPQRAQAVVTDLVAIGERYLNEVNRSLVAEELGQVREWVAESRDKLAQAVARLTEAQGRAGVADPLAATEHIQGVITRLEAELGVKEMELAQLGGYLTDSAWPVVNLSEQVELLRAQIAKQKKRLSPDNPQSTNGALASFADLRTEVEVATTTYRSALAALERASVEAGRKTRHLALVAEPQVPQVKSWPLWPRHVVPSLLGALALWLALRSSLRALADRGDRPC